MSVVEVLAVLYGSIMKYDPKNPGWEGRDYQMCIRDRTCSLTLSTLIPESRAHSSLPPAAYTLRPNFVFASTIHAIAITAIMMITEIGTMPTYPRPMFMYSAGSPEIGSPPEYRSEIPFAVLIMASVVMKGCILGFAITMPFTMPRPRPVSYTHLDVYKRQKQRMEQQV